jgi:hypothetical protein
MTSFTPVPDPVTPDWLSAALGAAGLLGDGQVIGVRSEATGAFNSRTQRLHVDYAGDVMPELARDLILKRNNQEPWGIEAGAEEVNFYQLMAALQPAPPALVPCYAAAYDSASGESYILLRDLSPTHAPPVTRDQQVSIVEGVPAERDIERVVDALAQHHAYWWDHPAQAQGVFEIGYWSRDADRFGQYLQRRRRSWADLLANEAGWLPDDLRALYERALQHLHEHWARHLEPRFRNRRHLTLLHGDAYFANFLCPKAGDGPTYLLDWQSPTVDIGGYDLANLCATFWTPEQRHAAQREERILRRYLAGLQAAGVRDYGWDDLIEDYQSGLIYWLFVPLQDRFDGASKDYWWPKMQCLVAAFREWRCEDLLG